MKSGPAFLAIAHYFAEEVQVPMNSGCCGMAGDRGFLIPELTASATKQEAMEACSKPADGYYSSTRTCEMAMEEATHKNYESILYLVDEAMNE
jgi:D-lactate dehydrogenase